MEAVLEYKLLPPEEWHKTAHIFAEFGYGIPPKETCLLSVAEQGNEIKGLLCVQPVMHMEPIWVKEDYRGIINVRKLQKPLLRVLPKGMEYYAFTPSRTVRWIAGTFGMKPLPWDIWKGEV